MIGVVVAKGEKYKTMAEECVETAKKYINVDDVVLVQNTRGIHPSYFKMYLFEFLSENRILSLDADIVCVDYWDPKKLPGKTIHAVKNNFTDKAVKRECEQYGIDNDKYFNCGVMVMDREPHAEVMRQARDIAKGQEYDSVFLEQTAINVAVQRSDCELNLLSRKYNVIAPHRQHNSVPRNPVILHHSGGGDEIENQFYNVVEEYRDER